MDRHHDIDRLISQLRAFQPYNEQEAADLPRIIDFLERNDDAFLRSNLTAHMTASAWVVNRDRSRILMVYHNIYNSWSWLGGHCDGETDPLQTALREVQEESGLTDLTPVTEDIFSVEVLTVNGHEKRGRYVPCHLHMNVTYLLEADEAEPLRIKPDENSGVAWFAPEEALAKSTEPWFVERVYKKLIAKSNEYN